MEQNKKIKYQSHMKKLFFLPLIVSLTLSNLAAQDVKFSLDPKTNLWGLTKGSVWLIKPKYIDISDFDTEGYARVEYYDLIGLVDKYGKEIVEPRYAEIGYFNQNRAIVRSQEGFYGYIDMSGKEIIATKYTKASSFTPDKWAVVASAKNPKPQDSYTIDLNGNVFFPGEWKNYFHKNWRTSAYGIEKNGRKIKDWHFYNEYGSLTSIEHYNNDGVIDGSYRRYFNFKYGDENVNNYPSQTGKFKNGKKDGLIVFYNPNNGKPTYTEFWENGVFKKVRDIYDINGNLVSSAGTGILIWYNEDSKEIAGKIEYQNGHRAGITIWYHPNKTNSQVRQKVLYKYDPNDVNGLRWEIIEINDYNGKPLPKGTLKNGNGTWISYDDNDKPTTITSYQNGKKVKEETAVTKD